MEVKALKEADLVELGEASKGPMKAALADPRYRSNLARSVAGWTLRDEDGHIIVSMGTLPIWPGRGQGWAVFNYSRIKPQHMVQITRLAKKYLYELSVFRRIEITVVADFDDGIRWAELLGFKRETPEPMKNYGPEGEDYYMYSLVK